MTRPIFKKENTVIAKDISKLKERDRHKKLSTMMFLPDKDIKEIAAILVKIDALRLRQTELTTEKTSAVEKITRRTIMKQRRIKWLREHPGKDEKDVPLSVTEVLEDFANVQDEEWDYIEDLWEEY